MFNRIKQGGTYERVYGFELNVGSQTWLQENVKGRRRPAGRLRLLSDNAKNIQYYEYPFQENSFFTAVNSFLHDCRLCPG